MIPFAGKNTVVHNKKILFLISIISIVDICFGQGVKLEHQFKQGEVYKYKALFTTVINSDMIPLGKSESQVEFIMEQRVDSVYEDGSALIFLFYPTFKMRANNQEVSNPVVEAFRKIKMFSRNTKAGKTIESFSKAMPDMPAPMKKYVESILQSLRQRDDSFPEKPVAINESWTRESVYSVEEPGGVTDTRTVMTYTLAGFQTINGLDCAKILAKGTIEVSSAGGKTRGEGKATGTLFFAYKIGKMVKMETKSTTDLQIETPNGTSMMTRIETGTISLMQ